MSIRNFEKKRWWNLIGMLLLILLGLSPKAVWAHTNLITADPVPGALLSRSPQEIRLTFGEPNDPLSRITLFAPGFRAIPGVGTSVNPAAPEQLIATLPPLEPDTYTVQWMAVATDKHIVRGSYTFGVQPIETWYLWLSVVVTLAIWLLFLTGPPWRKKLHQIRHANNQPMNRDEGGFI